jgi:hypothetical protein
MGSGFEMCSNIDIEVVVVDGIFMEKNSRLRFSSEMKGFHNYDLNISFEYKKNGYIFLLKKLLNL